jgi:cytochrome P450
MSEPVVVTVSTFEEARDAYRQKELRQALYDEGEIIMGDVLVNLHGDEHRARRRVENRLFRRDTFAVYERDLFPAVVEDTLKPHAAAGRSELVELSHEMMMNLAALTAGVDRPLGTRQESLDLYRYLMKFIEGATLAHSTRNKAVVSAEVLTALEEFDTEFLTPSVERRRGLLAAFERGEITEDELPRDVLTVLLRNQDDLHLPYEVLRREIAFFLLAGAHTSATAYTRSIDHIFKWMAAHPEDEAEVHDDPLFVQRCVHETIRLNPSSPVGMRWALADVTLRSGATVPAGGKLVIDLMAVNRDPALFGDNAGEFDPRRPLPEGIAPYGLSFGSGMHACIGQDMAGGLVPGPGPADAGRGEHLVGLVAVAVRATFDHGVAPDPGDPPAMDTTTKRPYWGRYPVLFRRS